jgi:radical SAM superfamily enzyme YgiQ (UPF0313 family)
MPAVGVFELRKREIFFADLTHTAQGISAATFPLGVSFVVSYAKEELDDEFNVRLFKMPNHLDEALKASSPSILACSNYSWNFELTRKIGALAKRRDPKLVFICGGPNFPTTEEEQAQYLITRPEIDFYIQLEGEKGFVALVRALQKFDFDVKKLKESGERIGNTSYVVGDTLVSGNVERIKDVNTIPSPYLTGVLDPFFDLPLVPMIETTRGCPFTCTFCADGLKSKSRITRFDPERTREELLYIATRLKNIDELIITDLNFAMYKEDISTANILREIRKQYKWPVIISASAGKNMPHRTIEVASILEGSWTLGASIQSTDPDVLTAIKRSNISSDAYKELIGFGSAIKTAKTHSEIILGLPGDSKEKHFKSLSFGVENHVNSMRMFQAMLLRGTEMASPETRKTFGLVTKFRTIPGCVGIYDLFDEPHPVSEIEEIIIGNNTLSFEDYLECRVMNLLVETFYNNALFEEAYGMLDAIEAPRFECLLYLKNHTELYTDRIVEIIEEFKRQTSVDLFDTQEDAEKFVLTPEIVGKYVGGELGINELLVHRALLFQEFEICCAIFYQSVRGALREAGRLTPAIEAYLSELERFTILRKKDAIYKTDIVQTESFYYDFEAIAEAHYRYNPNSKERLKNPTKFRFFHTSGQQRHISNQVKVYSNTPIGLGRLIQRSNMKLVYRSFEKADSSQKCDYGLRV